MTQLDMHLPVRRQLGYFFGKVIPEPPLLISGGHLALMSGALRMGTSWFDSMQDRPPGLIL